MSLRFRLTALAESFHWWLQLLIVRLQFGLLFPLATRLGGRPARILAGLTGRLCHSFDCDWRTASLRQHFVRGRTSMAMAELHPRSAPEYIESLVRQRFICSAHEELDGHYFFQGSGASSCAFEGLEAVLAVGAQRGIVFLTLHLDATLTGVVELGKVGIKLNLMTSSIVEDQRVPPIIRRYFAKKYEGIARFLNGGRVMHNETHLREFYRALERHESVVVLCEAPAIRREDGLILNFLDKPRAMSRGSLRLAEKTQSAVAGFICIRTGIRQYNVQFSPVFEPSADGNAKDNIVKVYSFLESAIREHPGLWWAADLLPCYPDNELPPNA